MPNAQVIAGCFSEHDFLWDSGKEVKVGRPRGSAHGTSLKGKVKAVQIVTEEQKKSLLKSSGAGLIGFAVFGPVGALAGVLAGGNKKELLFSCELKDGQSFVARGDVKIYEMLLKEAYSA